MKRFLQFFGNTISRPLSTMDGLSAERTIRWGIAAVCLPVLQVWANIALHGAFGLDWLGTKTMLADPTFVAGFGQVRINRVDWVPFFLILVVLLGVFNLVLAPGLAHVLSKAWGGQGTFEQMVNTIAFAVVVPEIVIGASSEWLFSVPMDLITGHAFWWVAAMQGEFGPVVAAIWNAYVLGIYLGLQYFWIIALGTIAVRRVERIPIWGALLTVLVVFGAWLFLQSVFVR